MKKNEFNAPSIPPHMARGLWSSGKGCAMCNYDDKCGGWFGFPMRYP